MSRHLSSEQISRWILGEHGAEKADHVRDCLTCRRELARMESVLTQFRSSVRHWSEVQAAAPSYRQSGVRTLRPRRWVLAAAALLILVTLPLYRDARERKRAAEQALADAVLMESVDRAVSRTVARPMEPLIELVAGDTIPREGSERKP